MSPNMNLLGDVDTREVKKVDINRWPDQYIDILYISKDGEAFVFPTFITVHGTSRIFAR